MDVVYADETVRDVEKAQRMAEAEDVDREFLSRYKEYIQ
jgi:hypothetical protein